MLMTQADDEDSQKKGIVGVLYNFSLMGERLDYGRILQSVRLRNCLPIRFVAMHYCFNHPSFVDFINCERSAFDEHTRARCRAHQGIFLVVWDAVCSILQRLSSYKLLFLYLQFPQQIFTLSWFRLELLRGPYQLP